jgi:hypothetical protein
VRPRLGRTQTFTTQPVSTASAACPTGRYTWPEFRGIVVARFAARLEPRQNGARMPHVPAARHVALGCSASWRR